MKVLVGIMQTLNHASTRQAMGAHLVFFRGSSRFSTQGAVTTPQTRFKATSAHSEVSQAAAEPPEQPQRIYPPSLHRRRLERYASKVTLNIAGVSFDNRQEEVMMLREGQPILFTQEPWNAYDPAAVRITTLGGAQLGYVPRDKTSHFGKHEEVVGKVLSTGPTADGGVWGARVTAEPDLAHITLDPLPAGVTAVAVTGAGRLAIKAAQAEERKAGGQAAAAAAPPAAAAKAPAAAGRGSQRQQQQRGGGGVSAASAVRAMVDPQGPIAKPILASAKGVCQVTGTPVGSDQQLVVVPRWQYNEKSKVMRCTKLLAVCREVWQASLLLEAQANSPEQQAASAFVQDINRWGVEDLKAYVRMVQARKARMEEQGGWVVEL